MRWFCLVLGLAMIATGPTVAAGAQWTLDFDQPPTTKLSVQYQNQGVILRGTPGIAPLDPGAHSGCCALASTRSLEFHPGPMVIDFTFGVDRVDLYTGIPNDTHGRAWHATLTAFDAGGAPISSATASLIGPVNAFGWTPMSVSANPATQGPVIREVQLLFELNGIEYIDDLTFFSEGQPPVAAQEPPTVTITSPANGAFSTTGMFTLSGEIHGDALEPEPDVAPPEYEIRWTLPPGSTAPSFDVQDFLLGDDLQWAGSPPSRFLTFSRTLQLSQFGTNTISVRAYNAAGTGSSQVTVTYISSSIQNLYQQLGGYSTFGGLLSGSTSEDCEYALYQRGAIFSTPTGVHAVLGTIFLEWQSLTTADAPLGTLGCATNDEGDVAVGTDVAAGRSQDFEGGRIYSGPTEGTHHVLEPFRDAIDRLDFVKDFGLPVSDTEKRSKYLLPRLWQRFARGIGNVTLFSNMEVTEEPGSTLTLWVATPDLYGSQRAGMSAPSARIPTVWYPFTCDALDKPCRDVAKPTPAAKTPVSFLKAGCPTFLPVPGIPGGVFPWTTWIEWGSLAPLEIKHILGNVKEAGRATTDYTKTHECRRCGLGADVFDWDMGLDYCVNMVPETGYEEILGVGEQDLELEYEYCLVGWPPADVTKGTYGYADKLRPGDKFFAAGHWIADCSHDWKSEIHPPAVVVDTYTDDVGGRPATVGEIVYMDWWRPGEIARLNVYPPPRPTPDARLVSYSPLWPQNCQDQLGGLPGACGISTELRPVLAPNHFEVTIRGRPDAAYNTPPEVSSPGGVLYFGRPRCIDCARCLPAHDYRPLWSTFVLYWNP